MVGALVKIITVATSHNRKDKTLVALQSLHAQRLPLNVDVEHVLVDDGSSDGTSDAVMRNFPKVKMLSGTGELFWAGGMRHAWQSYLRYQQFSALVVYNDDVTLRTDALSSMLEVHDEMIANTSEPFTVAGRFIDPTTRRISFGGRNKALLGSPGRLVPAVPNGKYGRVDTINMNLTLIPKRTIEAVGFLSDKYSHALADFDYGLRVLKQGGANVLLREPVGFCTSNPTVGSSRDKGLGGLRRLMRSLSIKEYPPRERLHFLLTHAGALGLFVYPIPYVRALIGGIGPPSPNETRLRRKR